MAGAENFFLKESTSNEEESQTETYFDEHIEDEKLIQEGID